MTSSSHRIPQRLRGYSRGRHQLLSICVGGACLLATGCFGDGTAGVGTAINVIGGVVDKVDVKDKEKDLLGRSPSAADQMFGAALDTQREVGGRREWRIYDVAGVTNPLDKDRYVVEVTGGRIRSLSRVETTPDIKFDLPRAALLEEKVKGKSPEECRRELEKAPIVSVRSEKTGRLRQLYDGRVIRIFSKPYYCILKFDAQDLCEDVDFQKVGASTRKDPYGKK
ncbi:MAG TPA: hypothetical protein P5081_17725 [Phycisphaerae bacterium]|nr:hypothetical protein [Phycisphaerae bacterium]HRW54711.1 hypothetical protein [Phycisphaerae bacterium]